MYPKQAIISNLEIGSKRHQYKIFNQCILQDNTVICKLLILSFYIFFTQNSSLSNVDCVSLVTHVTG